MKRFSLVAVAALISLCICGISMAQDCGCATPACEAACDACAPCAPKTICTPFNGFFLELFTRPACAPCAADTCAPCAPAPVACAPCGDVACGVKPCAIPCAPFNGFFRNMFAPCAPCGPACAPAPACEPTCK